MDFTFYGKCVTCVTCVTCSTSTDHKAHQTMTNIAIKIVLRGRRGAVGGPHAGELSLANCAGYSVWSNRNIPSLFSENRPRDRGPQERTQFACLARHPQQVSSED
jgi:hypothetical protein